MDEMCIGGLLITLADSNGKYRITRTNLGASTGQSLSLLKYEKRLTDTCVDN